MKKLLLTCGALSLIAAVPAAQAAVSTYNVTTTWYETDTQPNNSIFIGSFSFDSVSHTVSNLTGVLSESMNDPMTWLPLNYQLSSAATTGGLLVTTFLQPNTATFNGGGWVPGTNPYYSGDNGNAYARIFVNTTDPTTALTQGQIDTLAYADCTAGGMMGGICMTGISGGGTMGGYPLSQAITLAPTVPVPEPETYAMMLAGLGLLGFIARRRRQAVQ